MTPCFFLATTRKNNCFPPGISVAIFDGVFYPPPRLAADGYRMINANTAALYVNEPTCVPELIYDWHPWLFGDLACEGRDGLWGGSRGGVGGA